MFAAICSLFIILSTLQPGGSKVMNPLVRSNPIHNACLRVCDDLPRNDVEPVCMMFSRYKKGYQFFVNECHARQAICKENLLLHFVNPRRCFMSKQFFLPIA